MEEKFNFISLRYSTAFDLIALIKVESENKLFSVLVSAGHQCQYPGLARYGLSKFPDIVNLTTPSLFPPLDICQDL